MAHQHADNPQDQDEPGVAVKEPPAVDSRPAQKPRPGKTPPKLLPPYKVLLHNDDVNDFEYVIKTIRRLTALSTQDALLRAMEAHEAGLSLLLVTHKERAELYQEQFTSAGITVTIEPDEVS